MRDRVTCRPLDAHGRLAKLVIASGARTGYWVAFHGVGIVAMPILPAEPQMYPADLWQGGGPRSASGRRWWCLHTKPRQEKVTARQLRKLEIAHYLPQAVHESRTPSGRKTSAVLPLFPGYLFLFGDDRARLDALKTNTLANVLEVAKQDELASDLQQIHQMLQSGLPVLPEPTYPVGTHIRILNGPLRGLLGTIVRRGKKDQFVAVVHFLGRGASVELQDWQVEPADDEEPPRS